MRLARRQINPIFIEDESHHWKPRRSLFLHVLNTAALTLGLIGLVLLIVN